MLNLTVLYVTEPGASIGRTSERLVIRKRGETIQEIHLMDLRQVVIIGHVHITSHALRGMLRRGIDCSLLTGSGAYIGRVSSGLSANIDLRRAQFRQLEDPEFCAGLARRFVRGKLENLRLVLLRHQRAHPSETKTRALVAIRAAIDRLERAADLDVIRGHEGQASASYFGVLGELLRAPGITFERRIRRPPPDPVNILLSFGYTLLTNLSQGFVELAGLDPFLGALHAPERGRPSLPLDLIEEFRPAIVDVAVIRALNSRAVTLEDFRRSRDEESPVEDEWERADREAQGIETPPAERPLIFSPQGVKRFLADFERRMNERVTYPRTSQQLTYRQILREQVYLLARHIQGEETYEPFKLPV